MGLKQAFETLFKTVVLTKERREGPPTNVRFKRAFELTGGPGRPSGYRGATTIAGRWSDGQGGTSRCHGWAMGRQWQSPRTWARAPPQTRIIKIPPSKIYSLYYFSLSARLIY